LLTILPTLTDIGGMTLHDWTDVAGIIAAVVAVAGLGIWSALPRRRLLRRRKREIEALLKRKADPGDDTLTRRQIADELGMTEEQVIDVAARSKKVQPTSGHLGSEPRYRYMR
jgi:hypothetical protein